MFISEDTQEQIIISKLSNILKKYFNEVLEHNGDGENLLRSCGLSSLIEAYGCYLDRYSINDGYKEHNNYFNPGLCLDKIFLRISDNKEILGIFLSELFSRIEKIEKDDINIIKNYLEVLGYRLNVKKKTNYYGERIFDYSLAAYTDGIIKRQEDGSYLSGILSTKYSQVKDYYDEAISLYGTSKYKNCIENCRTVIEKIFQELDTKGNDFSKGVLIATKEKTPPLSKDTPKLTDNGIFGYWLEYHKGFNRYRLIKTMYSLMSALGPHVEEKPSKEDALLCLRVSEDLLLWYFQSRH